MTISSAIFTGYFGIVGTMFCLMAGPDMVNDMVHVDEAGNMVGNSYDSSKYGKISPLGIEVGTVYCEVIGAMAVMVAMASYFEGSQMRTFMTQLPLVSIMAKHVTVNGLIPPPPVMAMGGVVLLSAAYFAFATDGKGTDYSKYLFIVQNIINLAVFVMDPAQVVKDTWPDISGHALGFGVLFVGVIQLYCAVMVALFVLKAPASHFVAMSLGMGQLYRDVYLNDSGPPLPVLILFVVVFLSSVYGVLTGSSAPTKED